MKSRFFAAAFILPGLTLLSACDQEEEADTSFEQQMPAPVVVDDGPGPVPDNSVGTPQDDVVVDYDDELPAEDADLVVE
ncbi:hypothetical protein G7A66_07340 [Altererythrobacter sp. SALINAS58]|uniref:hypothetical protein n=1 Tax=Alteripontixanthobacter muriae TaxID=2705546 RepID=UPI0015760EC7|nr:hypothetical protein [Alteripontixanthobacter muriae]NTZ42901.1 hypothetical protein [Alteripontixanthobacter muriae]